MAECAVTDRMISFRVFSQGIQEGTATKLWQHNAAGRYDVHELLRQYGAEQLDYIGQTETVQCAYIDYYLGLLRQLEPKIKTHQQITALDTIAADFENVRHAWQLAIEQKHFVALAQAVESLHLFADMRGAVSRNRSVAAGSRRAVSTIPHSGATLHMLPHSGAAGAPDFAGKPAHRT